MVVLIILEVLEDKNIQKNAKLFIFFHLDDKTSICIMRLFFCLTHPRARLHEKINNLSCNPFTLFKSHLFCNFLTKPRCHHTAAVSLGGCAVEAPRAIGIMLLSQFGLR